MQRRHTLDSWSERSGSSEGESYKGPPAPSREGTGRGSSGLTAAGTAPYQAAPVRPEELLGPLSDLERKYAPETLFVSGKLEMPLSHPRVAIIGTRKASSEGLKAAAQLARALVRHGVTIVSGLAEGIDTAAHTAAISGGGRTVAVLGTPLSRTFPAKNRSLQELIVRDHLAVSQFPEHRSIQRENFVLRNRTMALIADASVIIESGEGGGSLHQGWEAIRLGRPLFIRKSMFGDPGLNWPTEMARYGAVELGTPREILDFVPQGQPVLTADGLG